MALKTPDRTLTVPMGVTNNERVVHMKTRTSLSVRGTSDYNELINKPQINSIVLQGNLSAKDLGFGAVYYDTTANWNLQRNLIAEAGAIYIYSDYQYIEDEVGNRTPIAGIRIGDGTSYLVDMPFVSDGAAYDLMTHIADTSMHTTSAEKEFWNNKVSLYLDTDDPETIIFSKTSYEKDGNIIIA